LSPATSVVEDGCRRIDDLEAADLSRLTGTVQALTHHSYDRGCLIRPRSLEPVIKRYLMQAGGTQTRRGELSVELERPGVALVLDACAQRLVYERCAVGPHTEQEVLSERLLHE
jgi:hypothetical protein